MKININVQNECKFDTGKMKSRVSEALKYGAEAVERTARELAPRDTGALGDSIHVTGGGWTYHVQPGMMDYAAYMEEGTSPHTITGNYYLYWEGADHPVHQVNHPGNVAFLYMEGGMLANVDNIAEFVLEALGDVFD